MSGKKQKTYTYCNTVVARKDRISYHIVTIGPHVIPCGVRVGGCLYELFRDYRSRCRQTTPYNQRVALSIIPINVQEPALKRPSAAL